MIEDVFGSQFGILVGDWIRWMGGSLAVGRRWGRGAEGEQTMVWDSRMSIGQHEDEWIDQWGWIDDWMDGRQIG